MEINDKLIDKLSDLSKLHFEGDKRTQIKQDLSQMLSFISKLEAVDTEGIEPLIHISEGNNKLREDVASGTATHQEALMNAPKADSDYIRVPKVLNKNKA